MSDLRQADWIRKLSKKTGYAAIDIKEVMIAFGDLCVDMLHEGNTLRLPGVGKFMLEFRPEQKIRSRFDPKFGQLRPPRVEPTFRFSKSIVEEFKEKVVTAEMLESNMMSGRMQVMLKMADQIPGVDPEFKSKLIEQKKRYFSNVEKPERYTVGFKKKKNPDEELEEL